MSYQYNVSMFKVFAIFMLFLFYSQSQANSLLIANTTQYQSDFDNSISFHKITYLPSIDNVSGIYSKQIDKKIQELIETNHRWDTAASTTQQSTVRPEELVGQPSRVLAISKNLNSDGFFLAEARKDPDQIHLQLYLFSARSGELIAEDIAKLKSVNTDDLLASLTQLYNKVLSKIPYDALVLSRTDNRITINVGEKDGVTPGQNLTVVKVISAKRHPQRHFLIESNKVILGQIRVVKVEKFMSFADVQTETESGVIQKGAKITGVNQIRYDNTPWTKNYTPPEQLLSENNKVVFGKNAREWIAKDPPTFGKIGAGLAVGSFNNNLGLSSGNNLDSKVQVYPRIDLHGEIWVTPRFYVDGIFAQGIGQSNNPSGGPSELSNSLTQYRMSVGYNFMLMNEFFGPKVTFDLGINNYKMYVDTTSNQGLTTMEYSSIPFGIGGYIPIDKQQNWALGGKAYFHLFPRLRETPFSSASGSDNTINHFHFFAERKWGARLRLNFGLEFLMLTTNFSGQGDRVDTANNSSQRFTLFNTSIDYLF